MNMLKNGTDKLDIKEKQILKFKKSYTEMSKFFKGEFYREMQKEL